MVEERDHQPKAHIIDAVHASPTGTTLEDAIPPLSSGELGKIQDILFGEQLRAYNALINKLSSDTEKQLSALSERCEQQFTALSERLDKELKAVDEARKQSNATHQAQLVSMNEKYVAFESVLLAKLNDNADNSARLGRQLQKEISASNEKLSKMVCDTREELVAEYKSGITQLQSKKIDRHAFSSLLNAMAEQLDNDTPPADRPVEP